MKQGRWAITAVSLILGIMVVLQIRATDDVKKNNVRVQRAEYLAAQLKESENKRDALQGQLYKLQHEETRENAKAIVKRLRNEAGLTPVKGKGIEIIIADSKIKVKVGENPNLYLIHDEDILKIINELRAAGAEAISINNQRLIAKSEIRCVGPTITINRKSFAPPYIIKAIGNPDALAGALELRGGVAESLKVWGIQLQINKEAELTVPGYDGTLVQNSDKNTEEGGSQ